MEKILLTIAIATYNRRSALKKQLNNIHSQLIKTEVAQYVEVLVSDNHSTDSTQIIVKDFIEMDRQYELAYCKNKENIGAGLNYVSAIVKSSGLFVWLMSDDDEILEGSIQYLYDILQLNQSIGFGFINFFFNNQNSSKTGIVPKNGFFISSDIDLLIPPLIASSMISSCVYRKSLLSERILIEKAKKLPGYSHLFSAKNLVQRAETLVITKPLFIAIEPDVYERRKEVKFSEKGTVDYYIKAHITFIKFISELIKSNVSFRTRLKLYRYINNENLNQIIYHKITSEKYDFSTIKYALPTMVKRFYFSPVFWLVHVPILIFPAFFAKHFEPYRWKYIKLRGSIGVFVRKFIIGTRMTSR